MKKILNYHIVLLAGLALSLACSKIEEAPASSEETLNPTEQGEQTPPRIVTISVSMPEEGLTKVAFEQDPENKDGSVKLTWEEGDKILINNTEFTLVSGAGTQTAGFSGPEVTAESYTIAYNGGAFSASQHQAADANTEHLAYVISLAGVNTYQDVEFTQAWATAHGNGTLTQSSIFRLRAQMPSGVADKVTAVKIEARDASDAAVNIFGSGNKLTIMIDEAGDAGEDGILDIYANLPTTAAAIPAGTAFFVRFLTSDRGSVWSYTRYHVFTSALYLTPGKVNALKLNCTVTDKHAGNKTVCDGTTAEKAYLIGDPYQVAAINGLATGGRTTYFKMVDNVDMTGVTHNPINTNSGYTQFVNFDGNNKTISKLGKHFFYVFKGSIQNLTLSGSSVGTSRGIFAEFCQGEGHTITNVDIINGSMAATSANGGALIGRINNGSGTTASITDCDVTNTTVSGAAQTGGLIGSADAKVVVSNCTVSKSGSGTSSVTASGANSGGLIGYTTGVVTITDCTVSGTDVTGTGVVGGVVGFANSQVTISGSKYTGGTVSSSATYCGGFMGSTKNVSSLISSCQVENATIDVSETTGDIRAGGFIGQLQTSVQVKGCTVGTSATYVKIKAGAYDTTNSKVINTGGFVGVNYGKITKDDSNNRSSAYVDVTTTNTDGSKDLNLGGFVGYHSGVIEFSDAIVTMKKSDGTSNILGRCIGGFCGRALSGATLDNCNVSGAITGGGYTGGFVGIVASDASIIISNCQVLSGTTVTGNNTPSLGGFAGAFLNGTCNSNTTYANVSGGSSYTGGFVGYAVPGGKFSYCHARGTVSSNNTYVGGFVGQAGGASEFVHCRYWGTEVKSTYNSSNDLCLGGFCGGVTDAFTGKFEQCWVSQGSSGLSVTSTNNKPRVGGFIGQLGSSNSSANTGTFHQCRAHKVTVQGGQYTGGFAGVSYATIEECCISGGSNVNGNGNSCGGFIGYQQYGNVTNCYSTSPLKLATGRSYVGGLIGNCQNSIVSYSYCTGFVDNTSGVSERGGFIGHAASVYVEYCIASQETAFCGTSYSSESGKNHRKTSSESDFTVKKWATEYGWDTTDIWTTDNTPTLRNTNTAP